jgi:L-lysine 6-transaminase
MDAVNCGQHILVNRRTNMTQPKDVRSVLGKHILVDGFHVVIDLQKSKGSYIVDAIDGRRYLDMYCYFSTLPIGHNHPKMFEPAFLAQLQRAAIANPANSDIYCVEYADSVDTFARLAKPAYMRYLFFVAGGALGVENALKAAFDWKVRKNFKKGYKRERGHQVIHFRESFHGRSGYTLSLTNTDPNKTDLFAKFSWPRIDNPKLTFPVTESVLEAVVKAEAKALRQIKKAISENKDDVAALIIEPIQGEGGDNHFRGEFLRSLRQICDESDIMFIFDEIQTGFGITGKMWAFEHFDVEPDMIAFGKRSQICGVMANTRIDEVQDNVFHISGRINSTWGGNLVDMLRCKRYLEIIDEENMVRNAAVVGDYLLKRLEELARKYPQKISCVRGRGLFIAFDLPSTEERNKFRTRAWENGIATLPSGKNSARFRPALNLSKSEANEAIALTEKSL